MTLKTSEAGARPAPVGVRANCSVVLVHHTRKLGGTEATAEQARGAIALVGAARSVIALNKMSPEEAGQFGIEGEDRRRFFRAYDDKNNRTPPADKSDWYQLASVDLGNGPADGQGDSLPVVLPWVAPDAFSGVTLDHLMRVQAKVREADYRKDPQSPDWVTEFANIATKMSRTFTTQMETLSKLRRGGEQVVKYVHVHEGGQAVVAGTINQGGRVNGKGRDQAHGQATDAPLATLSGPDAARDGVPLACDAEREMSPTRGQEHGGS